MKKIIDAHTHLNDLKFKNLTMHLKTLVLNLKKIM